MRENKLRSIINEGKSSVSTRLWSTWAFFYEALASTGKYDYAEFVAEYSPFSQYDLENMCRASELYGMGTMIKLDFQNRLYVAQKAVASGFQAVMFADHETPEQFRESIAAMKSNTPGNNGHFGFPNRRFIGCNPHVKQMEHAKRVDDIVLSFMIEKKSTVDCIEEICEIDGIDMIQFGPSDFSMSNGRNRGEYEEECLEAERRCIKAAIRNGILPRCEISSADQAKYYIDLGVKHFSVGDQFKVLKAYWEKEGDRMYQILEDEGII